MAELKQPRKSVGYLGEITALEPFKMKLNGGYFTAMVLRASHANTVLVINRAGEMVAHSLSSLSASEFLGYLTTEESLTITGSLPTDWVEPEISDSIAGRRIDLSIGAPATDVPDFVPYRMRAGSDRFYVYDTINVPRTNGERIGLCIQDERANQYASLGTNQVFDGYLNDVDLRRWREHKSIASQRTLTTDQWPP